MLKLWHKYALALFAAALIPLGIAGVRIADSGAAEVRESATRLHATIGDVGYYDVWTYIETAVNEATGIAATLGTQEIPAEQRMALAQAELVSASTLSKLIVFSPSGKDVVVEMTGGDASGQARLADIPSPNELSESLLEQAFGTRYAFDKVIATPSGERFLPLIVRTLKANGEARLYGWTVVPLAPLIQKLGVLSEVRLSSATGVTLIDADRNVIAHTDPDRIGKPFAENGANLGISNPKIFERQQSFVFSYTNTEGVEYIGAVTTIPQLKWGVVVEQPLSALMGGVDRIWSTTFLVGGIFAALALIIGILAGRRLSAPIVELSKAAGVVAGGDFTARVKVRGRDEVGQLANAFNSMAGQLSATVEELKAVTAMRERMQTELDIGRKIQMSMVPLDFPAFPDREEFEIHAALHPAFEVGGDFYDFFLIDDDHLCVVVADVSGKGVPAALFMAVTRTLVKAHAHGGASSEEIVEKVNDDLAADNEACMFVTVFVGILDIRNGRLVYTNAGHNPSYIKRLSGKVERLDKLHGPVVAAMEEIPYAQAETTLQPGEALFMYTDGVNEAMNAKEELFTEERLAKLLEKDPASSAAATVKVVLDDVWLFQGEADQADDVTVVALRYLGPAKT